MGCPDFVLIEEDLKFSITTHDPDTGVLNDADSAPTYRIYENETGVAILTGSMTKLDDDNTVGLYAETLSCTAANGFEDQKVYSVYVEATVATFTGGISYEFIAYSEFPVLSLFDILNGEARWANVERNLNKYFFDNIYTTEGVDVDILGMKFTEKDAIEWVRPRLVSMNSEYLRQASDAHYGEDVDILFTVDCFVTKSGTTISDRHYVLRDTVANYFKIGQDVKIEDYVKGSTSTNTMRVREIVKDSPAPETQTYYQYSIGWLLDYTRKTVKP